MTTAGVVTTKLIREWLPVSLSVLAMGFALFNYMADTQTRLTVLELTVEKTLVRQIDQNTESIRVLRDDVDDIMRNQQ